MCGFEMSCHYEINLILIFVAKMNGYYRPIDNGTTLRIKFYTKIKLSLAWETSVRLLGK
jgi:hypothetical protein